jgi:uncharacterized protein
MTPQERQLIDDLFDRLAKLENAPRDPEAMSAIMQGLRTAPNAVYALVQTALVQDEALRRANDRIQELEAGHAAAPGQSGGFLDSMREAVFGQNQAHGSSPGSVPNVRAPDMGGRPTWNSGQVLQQTQPPGQYNQPGFGQPYGGQPYGGQQPPPLGGGGGGGGSFLGTAAAAAAGVVGGSLLLNSIRGMMGGGGGHQAFGDTAGQGGGIEDRRPWGDQSGGNLARDAGVNDIGSSGSQRADNDYGSRQGYLDQDSHDDNDTDHDSDGYDGDDGDGGDGDGDYA